MKTTEVRILAAGKMQIATCIGCGCTDDKACVTAPTLDFVAPDLQTCFWVKVDRQLRIGVCSECVDEIGQFEERQRRLRRLVAEARRTA